jgi:hypothetical protein
LQNRPRFTQDIKTNYEKEIWAMKFNANLAARHTDIVQYSGFGEPADQVFIFDGKLMLALPKIIYGNTALFLLGKNLFNQRFAFDKDHDPNPGRRFEAGVEYKF